MLGERDLPPSLLSPTRAGHVSSKSRDRALGALRDTSEGRSRGEQPIREQDGMSRDTGQPIREQDGGSRGMVFSHIARTSLPYCTA